MKVLSLLFCAHFVSAFQPTTDNSKIEGVLKSNTLDIVPIPQRRTILFYPGKISRVLPQEMYHNFIDKLKENNDVHIANEKNSYNTEFLEENSNAHVVAHATGANDAIELIRKTNFTNNFVLIDPIEYLHFKPNKDYDIQFNVDNLEETISDFLEANKFELVMKQIFKKKDDKNPITNSALVLQSQMSSRWRVFPPIPPISKYSINLGDIKNKKIKTVEEYGAFDILDQTWGNFLHNTVAKGSSNRESEHISTYHTILVDHIDEFLDN